MAVLHNSKQKGLTLTGSRPEATAPALAVEEVRDLNRTTQRHAGVKAAQNAATEADVDKLTLNREAVARLDPSVSHKIDRWSAADQKRSGRCWIFAGLNSLRASVMATENIKDFEFSQGFVHFYDKLEKANHFLAAMIQLADRDIDDRTVQRLLSAPVEDGGQWNMFVAVIEKYGVVPKYAMSETWSSEHTASLNRDLATALRRGALDIRAAEDATSADAARRSALAAVHRILVVHLGLPPEEFVWQYRDADGVFHRQGTLTPREFAAKYLPEDLGDYVCVVNDPRNEYFRPYTVDQLGNVVGAPQVTYLNAPIDVLRHAAMASVVDGLPVWFGCQTTAFTERERGLWANDLYERSSFYGLDDGELELDKAERLRTGESLMEHAMVFTGVDLSEADIARSEDLKTDGDAVQARRWRVENSWGTEKADKGFWTMDDNWFGEYVFEVAVPPRYLPERLLAVSEEEPTVLPAWDPMGALA